MRTRFLSAAALVLSAAFPAHADPVSDYMKSATQVLLLGQACAAVGKAPSHDATVVRTVADLVALGYEDAAAARAVDSLLKEKGPGVTAILEEEQAASGEAAVAYFCGATYPERLGLHEKLRASLGLR